MKPGDWITQIAENYDGHQHNYGIATREFYEFVDRVLSRIRAHPIIISETMIDRTKRPHYLDPREWRLATEEEKARVILERIHPPKKQWMDANGDWNDE